MSTKNIKNLINDWKNNNKIIDFTIYINYMIINNIFLFFLL